MYNIATKGYDAQTHKLTTAFVPRSPLRPATSCALFPAHPEIPSYSTPEPEGQFGQSSYAVLAKNLCVAIWQAKVPS